MSKHHPNQQYYKVGGSGQSDGADRGDDTRLEKQQFARVENEGKRPAVKRSAKKK